MTSAAILLLVAGFLIFLYYLIMFQERGKISHFFGMLAGLWAFFGVFFVVSGAVGTGYFLFFFIILVMGYVVNLFVPEKYYEPILEKVEGVTEKIPSISLSEEGYQRLPVVGKMDEESGLGVLTAFMVFILYFVFLLSPVTPADSDAPVQFEREEGSFKAFPNAYKIEYTNGRAKVVIITIRMVPISKGVVDSAIEKAEPEIRDHIRKEVGEDAEIRKIEENDIKRNGHDAVQKIYEVEWSELGEWGETKKKGTLILEGWYCSNNLEVVAVAVFYPKGMESTREIADNVHCH